MYGSKLRILVFSCLAILVALVLSIKGFAPSWSQNALTPTGMLLSIVLGSVMLLYYERGLTHINTQMIRTSFFGMAVRQEHLNFFTSLMFFGILIFPVTHPHPTVEVLHLIFTGAGIVGVFLDIMTYRHKQSWLFKALIITSVMFFLVAFLFDISTIAWGETAIAAAAIVFVLKTNKIK